MNNGWVPSFYIFVNAFVPFQTSRMKVDKIKTIPIPILKMVWSSICFSTRLASECLVLISATSKSKVVYMTVLWCRPCVLFDEKWFNFWKMWTKTHETKVVSIDSLIVCECNGKNASQRQLKIKVSTVTARDNFSLHVQMSIFMSPIISWTLSPLTNKQMSIIWFFWLMNASDQSLLFGGSTTGCMFQRGFIRNHNKNEGNCCVIQKKEWADLLFQNTIWKFMVQDFATVLHAQKGISSRACLGSNNNCLRQKPPSSEDSFNFCQFSVKPIDKTNPKTKEYKKKSLVLLPT